MRLGSMIFAHAQRSIRTSHVEVAQRNRRQRIRVIGTGAFGAQNFLELQFRSSVGIDRQLQQTLLDGNVLARVDEKTILRTSLAHMALSSEMPPTTLLVKYSSGRSILSPT